MADPYESPRVDPYRDETGEDSLPALRSTGEIIGPLFLLLFAAALVAAAFLPTAVAHLVFDRYPRPNLANDLTGCLGVAALLLAGWRRCRAETTFPTQFGHWILLIYGTSWFCAVFFEWFSFQSLRHTLQNLGFGRRELAGDPQFHLTVIHSLLIVATAAVPLLAARQPCADKLWRRFAWMIAVLFCFRAIFPWVREQMPFWMLASVATATFGLLLFTYAVAAVRDVVKAEPRDQLHWLGISLPLLAVVLTIALMGVSLLWNRWVYYGE